MYCKVIMKTKNLQPEVIWTIFFKKTLFCCLKAVLHSQVLKWIQSSYDFKVIDLLFVTDKVNIMIAVPFTSKEMILCLMEFLNL